MKDIVCKFGGSSLADSDKIKNVSNIVKTKNRRFVVVSAPGKRNKNDIKITDALISMYNKAKEKKSYEEELFFIKNRFENISKELNIDIDLERIFLDIEANLLSSLSYDYIISRGEYLNALIIAKYLGYTFLDSVEFMLFNNGTVDLEKSRQRLLSIIDEKGRYVIPGFYGIDNNGEVKTFSRGGSDITGAVVSALLDSKIYENYTDVDGVMTIDPAISNTAKVVSRLSYSEIRSLSFSGACVLHPDCVNFLKENNIALNLLNSFNPTLKGSEILSDNNIKSNTISSLAGQAGYNILLVKKFSLHSSIVEIEQILSILKKNNINITQIHFGIDNVSVIIKDIENTEKILKEIKDNINAEKVELIDNISILSVVGQGILWDKELELEVLNAIYDTAHKIYTISRSKDVPSIMITLPSIDLEDTLIKLHERLFGKF